MNEQIKKLVDQAKKSVPAGLAPEQWLEVYHTKFAELIVKECAKIADDGCGSACFGLGINGAMLLEHFGVEE